MASQNRNAPITRLPAEIIGEIMKACESPLTFRNLATACQELARLAEPTLHRHRSAYRQFRFASDLDPTCLPTLVRSVVLHQDPVVMRYARSIDIWGARMSWDEWRQYEVDERGVHLRGGVAEFNRFNHHEIKRLLALTRDLVGEEELEAARQELESGADGLIKFLVIVSCPCLETLKFIRRNDVWNKSCQNWLEKSIQYALDHGTRFPPGLLSLREAAFGVDAGISDAYIHMIDRNLRPDRDGRRSLSRLLQIPGLKSLYYRVESDLGSTDDDNGENSRRLGLPAECSRVQHLFVDHVMAASLVFLEELGSSMLDLRSFAFRQDTGGTRIGPPNEFLESLAYSQSDYLEKLMFYNPWGFYGYRCERFLPENMEGYQRLEMWYQNTHDLEMQAYLDNEDESPGREWVSETFRRYLSSYIPNPQVLVLEGGFGEFVDDKASAWSYFDDAIAAVIKYNKEGEEATRSLKAIFVPAPNSGEDDLRRQQGDPSSEKPMVYPNAVKAAEENDVDLYVFGNGRGTSVKKHALDFPQAVTKWDIPTGPHYGRRVMDGFTAFNPLTGEWRHSKEPGSSGCYIEM